MLSVPAARPSASSALPPQRTGDQRVLFLAVDAMVPSLVHRYRDTLPNIRRIIREGYSGRILPYVSCWVNMDFMSMMTGAPPGTQYRENAPAGGPERHRQCVSETIWHSLAAQGRKSLLFDFPGAISAENIATAAGLTLQRGAIYQTPDVEIEGLYSEDLETTGWPPGGGPKPGRSPDVIPAPNPASGDSPGIQTNRPPLETVAGDKIALVIASGPDYDTVAILDRSGGRELARTRVGQWSAWVDTTVKDATGAVRYKLLEIAPSGRSLQLLRSPVCAREGFTQPREIASRLAERIGPIWTGSAIPPSPYDPYWEAGAEESRDGLARLARAAIASLDFWDWRFFVHKVSIVDTALHQCLTLADPSYYKHDPAIATRADAVFRRSYEDFDHVIGQLLEAIEKRGDTTLIIASDHGGGVNNVVCDVNQRLRDAGLLAGTDRKIDWARSRAYTKRNRQGTEIYVNLRGREPHGIVSTDDYERVQEQVIDTLLDWRSPLDNSRVITYALKLRDAALIGYWGPEAGDIQFCYNPGFVWGVNPDGSAIAPARSPVSNHGPQIVTGETGYSTMMGQILAWGPGVARGVERDEKAHGPIPIASVAPTVSRLLGCPVPADCQLGPIDEMLAGV